MPFAVFAPACSPGPRVRTRAIQARGHAHVEVVSDNVDPGIAPCVLRGCCALLYCVQPARFLKQPVLVCAAI
eukprot:5624663-Lingulodinium_polyedra.AAC.1